MPSLGLIEFFAIQSIFLLTCSSKPCPLFLGARHSTFFPPSLPTPDRVLIPWGLMDGFAEFSEIPPMPPVYTANNTGTSSLVGAGISGGSCGGQHSPG